VEPSSPVSESSSEYHSPRNSVVSGDSVYTSASQHSAVRQTGRLRSERSYLLNSFGASGPLSPLKVALTTRVSTWTSGGQPPVITGATMEGLIHYLLLKRDGERYTLSIQPKIQANSHRRRQGPTRHLFRRTHSVHNTFACTWKAHPYIR
jgi:hypothetical protein